MKRMRMRAMIAEAGKWAEEQRLSILRLKPCYHIKYNGWIQLWWERAIMSPSGYVYNVEVMGKVITIKWKHDNASATWSRYPEIEFSFDYLNISEDTVRAMLRDMEVPDFLANAVMTRIAADVS